MDISDLEKTLEYFYDNRGKVDGFTTDQINQNVFESNHKSQTKSVLEYLVEQNYIFKEIDPINREEPKFYISYNGLVFLTSSKNATPFKDLKNQKTIEIWWERGKIIAVAGYSVALLLFSFFQFIGENQNSKDVESLYTKVEALEQRLPNPLPKQTPLKKRVQVNH